MKSLNKIILEKTYRSESPAGKIILDEIFCYPGLKFETQFEVKPYRIDIAFPNEKLGLEIDGFKYHSKPGQVERDILRDEYLEEVKGWKIERIPAWFCFRYPMAAALKGLRHLPNIEKFERYKYAKTQAITWYASMLENEGEHGLAKKTFEELLE